MLKKIILVLVLFILTLGCSNQNIHKTNNTANQQFAEIQNLNQQTNIKYTINVVDTESKKAIDEVYVSIVEANKKYLITSASNVISLPEIAYSDPGKYHYGYSMITIAEGYLPRIDHSFPSISEVITLELKPVPKESSNELYTEYFHGASINEVAETLSYYEKLSVEDNK